MAIQQKDRRAVGVKVLPEGVEEYCERHTTALTELHERLLSETEEKTTTANFLVGEFEGAFLKMLVRICQARTILEVGMFTGYSALSFRRGVAGGWPDRHLRARPACHRNRQAVFR